MTEYKILYSKDLLYPTDNIYEPGSIHVDILSMDKIPKIPILIESKTEHSPLKYIDCIIKMMQHDIFDRILVDIKSNASIYIKLNNDMKKKFADKKYARVIFDRKEVQFKAVDEIEL